MNMPASATVNNESCEDCSHYTERADTGWARREEVKKLIAIAGGKGGVGKSFLAVSMGIMLARQRYNTVIVDASFSSASVHQLLNIGVPKCSIQDYIENRITALNELLLACNVPNLQFIAGSPGTINTVNLGYHTKRRILRNIRKIDADYIILDLGPGHHYNHLDFFNQADIKIAVISPEPMAVQDGYNFLKVSLLRWLVSGFKHNRILSSILQDTCKTMSYNRAAPIQLLSERINDLGEPFIGQWSDRIRNYRPSLLVNQVRSQDDIRECLSLQYAAHDLLGLEFDKIDCIHYDPSIRTLHKNRRVDHFLTDNTVFAADIGRIIEQMILKTETPAPDFQLNFAAIDAFEALQEKGEKVCSVNCESWNSCCARNGGYPCRLLTFLNAE